MSQVLVINFSLKSGSDLLRDFKKLGDRLHLDASSDIIAFDKSGLQCTDQMEGAYYLFPSISVSKMIEILHEDESLEIIQLKDKDISGKVNNLKIDIGTKTSITLTHKSIVSDNTIILDDIDSSNDFSIVSKGAVSAQNVNVKGRFFAQGEKISVGDIKSDDNVELMAISADADPALVDAIKGWF